MNERLRAMTIRESASIRDAVKAIERGQTNTAFIVDGEGRLVGLVTDGDIRRAMLKNISQELSIRTIMNTNPVTLRGTFDPVALYPLMIERHILCIPILDDAGRVIEFLHLPALAERLRGEHVPGAGDVGRPGTVLVIGGAGYIGSVLVRELLGRGYTVRALDSLMYGDDSLAGVKAHPGFELLQGDTRNVELVSGALKGMSAVIHLGEIVGDPACDLNPDFTIDVNYLATRRIAEACGNLGIGRLIFASSCSVYGVGAGILEENSPLNPVSLYAKCKIEAERALISLARQDFFPTVFRLGTVFGLSFRPRFDLVVNLLAAQAVVRKKVSILGGDQWRPFVHVRDVVDVLIECLQAPVEIVGGQIFNFGYDELNHQIKEIAAIIKGVVSDVEVQTQPSDNDRRDYRVSFAKVKRVFGLTQGRPIREGILEIKRAIEEGEVGDYMDRKYSNYLNFMEA